MNQRGRIIHPDSRPEVEFEHILHNTYHASTVTGVRQVHGVQQVQVQQYGGPTKLEWAALVIAAGSPTMAPTEATRRAFDVLQSVLEFTGQLRAQLAARRDVANGESTPGTNGSPQ